MLDILRDFGLQLLIGQYPAGPLGGLALTLVLSVSVLVLALPLAIVVGVARGSRRPAIAAAAALYANAIRGQLNQYGAGIITSSPGSQVARMTL